MYIQRFGSACTGACLLGKRKDGGPGTQVARQRCFLRWLALRVLPAAPDPPLEVLPRFPRVSPSLEHYCMNAQMNLMDA
jgi:hypothetical protein